MPLDRCLNCDHLASMNAQLADEISGLLKEVRRLSSENTRLRRQLNGDTSSEAQNVKELCAYHDEKYRAQFKRSKGLDYPMDGANAKAFKKALGMSCMISKQKFTVDDLKRAVDGVFLSDFHVGKTKYCYPGSFLENENKIRDHIQRADDFERLVTTGMDEARARRMLPVAARVHTSPPPQPGAGDWTRCPGCGSPAACWADCPTKALAA